MTAPAGHRTPRPNDRTECRSDVHQPSTDRHTCGVVARQVSWGAATRSVRAVGPELGRDEADVVHVADVVAEVVGLVCAAVPDQRRGHGLTVASFLGLIEVGQPAAGCRCIPSSRPVSGVIMKPCGHDHGELNHVSRPHRGWVMPILELRRGRARHHAASGARQRISPSRRP